MATILVTGVGGPAGRSVTTLLLDRAHQVIGTDMQAVDASLLPAEPEKRANIRIFQVPPARDPGFLLAVLEIAKREHPDLIIPTVSEELPVFAGGWRWGDQFPVLISSSRAVEIANDKYLTCSTLAGRGVSVPRFALPSQVHSAADLAEKIGWPCISKPRVGRGGREVALHSEGDWPLIQGLGDRYILQEFAPGTDYAPNLYLGPDGQAVVVAIEKTELKEGIVGNALRVKRVDSAREAGDVTDLAVAAGRAAGLTGPLDVDIRRRADGVPVVLEINARFGANIRHAPEILDAALSRLSQTA